jgi:hypothetical protein
VGIFRICASASLLKKLKARLLAGEDIDMNAHDPDTAAGTLGERGREEKREEGRREERERKGEGVLNLF